MVSRVLLKFHNWKSHTFLIHHPLEAQDCMGHLKWTTEINTFIKEHCSVRFNFGLSLLIGPFCCWNVIRGCPHSFRSRGNLYILNHSSKYQHGYNYEYMLWTHFQRLLLSMHWELVYIIFKQKKVTAHFFFLKKRKRITGHQTFNPLSPDIPLQILQTDLHTFP